ncbi:hypothetical protein [Rhizobium sp. YK2]|uniref:hypothetical protein n=1 Tax=Rhizobium sp. YK2 TaxID=1860096 RepID=UPI00084CDC50|nr:hypothetical protein [Rhizobium sp. YK2]OEC93562.1 hypothetical protein A9Z06_09020 [Rhizobium sp. YK2]
MPNANDIKWFKEQFHAVIETETAGGPFDLDMMTALACQETGEIWPILRHDSSLTVDQIAALCVGDTLDASAGRSAFPKNKADLIAANRGQDMFDIAHQALLGMAAHVPSYRDVATKPNKFVHGYGVWQYDLQFFLSDPNYFLQKRYENINETLRKALEELHDALKKVGFQAKTSLSDMEKAIVAIAYNTGGYNPSKGLKQGFKDDSGRFYGEAIFDFILLSKTVAFGDNPPVIAPPPAGIAIVPPPTGILADGKTFVVSTKISPLRLRSAPVITDPPGENVVAQLPDGQPVRAVDGKVTNGFREVETSLLGANLHGFAFSKFLTPASASTDIPIVSPQAEPPANGIVAVYMPRRDGTVTKRTDFADAHSLNESRQPTRSGASPTELIDELETIIDWLASDDPDHARYQPRDGLTFCNIYTHDYCFLAGAYLPRVWWTPKALIALSHGTAVTPLIGDTIDEMRANDLFRWLRDFGPMFGWRQTGTLTKLQQSANQGGLGIIIARRKEEGRSGHMVMVVPESDTFAATRNAAGDVIAPLQSQAGAVNFRRGVGRPTWWSDDRFAESAFWIHG